MPASMTVYLPATAKSSPAFDWRFWALLAAPVVGLALAFALGVDVGAAASQM